MEKKKLIRYGLQIGAGFAVSAGIMASQGAFSGEAMPAADRLLAVCNGVSVTAMLYLCFGALAWVSTTGMFDIFSYAVRRGAHFLIPFLGGGETGNYYEYKVEKQEKRKSHTKSQVSTLLVGAGFLLAGIILTVIWYRM